MKIKNALISVYHKEGLDRILTLLREHDINILSTGGTQSYIESQGHDVQAVEDITGYPSILDGRVKTLHPGVFGGILARRTDDHLEQLTEHKIVPIDLVIVDLYPFVKTVAESSEHQQIIEKIDIGGISLIRAAAKNYESVLVISSQSQYSGLESLLGSGAQTTADQRLSYARKAFLESTRQDLAIIDYLDTKLGGRDEFRLGVAGKTSLRYGENPHQEASFFGAMSDIMTQLHGKAISYNNLVDIDAAIRLIAEFWDASPTAAILKHTNSCGVAQRDDLVTAWKDALAGDPVSAFGGIFVVNGPVDIATATAMNKIFFEVVIAPDYDDEALKILKSKKNRIILHLHQHKMATTSYKQILNGVIVQKYDQKVESEKDITLATRAKAKKRELEDLLFASICAKHLKSNTIALVKHKQLIGMGCGQTSRVDALKQAIHKAKGFGFKCKGGVMASDAFFPFADCVEIAHKAGIRAVIQPGGSIRDRDSIEFCDKNEMAMYLTGTRHFKH